MGVPTGRGNRTITAPDAAQVARPSWLGAAAEWTILLMRDRTSVSTRASGRSAGTRSGDQERSTMNGTVYEPVSPTSLHLRRRRSDPDGVPSTPVVRGHARLAPSRPARIRPHVTRRAAASGGRALCRRRPPSGQNQHRRVRRREIGYHRMDRRPTEDRHVPPGRSFHRHRRGGERVVGGRAVADQEGSHVRGPVSDRVPPTRRRDAPAVRHGRCRLAGRDAVRTGVDARRP